MTPGCSRCAPCRAPSCAPSLWDLFKVVGEIIGILCLWFLVISNAHDIHTLRKRLDSVAPVASTEK